MSCQNPKPEVKNEQSGEQAGPLQSETVASFTNAEMMEMVLLYGECGKNARKAERLYAERFPGLRHPKHNTISNVVARLRETGGFKAAPRTGRPRTATAETTEADVLAYVSMHPHASRRAIAVQSGISAGSVDRILHRHNYVPYHVNLKKSMQPADFDYMQREDFCNWLLVMQDDDPSFLGKVMWTSEAKFTSDDVVPSSNLQYWSPHDQHLMAAVQTRPLPTKWSVNVWCGIWCDYIIGPVFYDEPMNGERYLHFLQNTVGSWLEKMPSDTISSIWFQHDRAPHHNLCTVRNWLDGKFGAKWIGLHGPVEWPPRSPDLSPVDFFMWAHVKENVYFTHPVDQANLRFRITNVCLGIDADMIRKMRLSLVERLQKCVAAGGRYFENGE